MVKLWIEKYSVFSSQSCFALSHWIGSLEWGGRDAILFSFVIPVLQVLLCFPNVGINYMARKKALIHFLTITQQPIHRITYLYLLYNCLIALPSYGQFWRFVLLHLNILPINIYYVPTMFEAQCSVSYSHGHMCHIHAYIIPQKIKWSTDDMPWKGKKNKNRLMNFSSVFPQSWLLKVFPNCVCDC